MSLDDILESLHRGRIDPEEAKKRLALYSIGYVGEIAKVDLGRGNRRRIPEIIYAEKKELGQLRKIIARASAASDPLLVSRIQKEDYAPVLEYCQKLGLCIRQGKCTTTISVGKSTLRQDGGTVGILSAGTSDIGVAEEARLVAEAMGSRCVQQHDVGVAGIHRLFPALRELIEQDADVVIVLAGMEGALPTIVSSLVPMPVIGVPVSAGYGYGGDGVGALTSMLQSCALGLCVVNIDNGVGAGAAAANIAIRARSTRKNAPDDARQKTE